MKHKIRRIFRTTITFFSAALITAAAVVTMAALASTGDTMQNMTGNDNKVFAFNTLGDSLVRVTVLGSSFTLDYQKLYAARDTLGKLVQADLSCLPAIAGLGLDGAGQIAADMAGSVAKLPGLVSQLLGLGGSGGSGGDTQQTTQAETHAVY